MSSLSVDLVQGMFRQLDFTNKLCSNYAYWTRPAVLDAAITRYDMFLRIVPSAKGKMLVPTLDIDLAWHAHQQADAAYRRYTKKVCGSVLNHDDDITGGDTAQGYTRAFMKWSQRYGEALSEMPPDFSKYRYGQTLRYLDPLFYYKWYRYSRPRAGVRDVPTADEQEVSTNTYNVVGTPVHDPRARPNNQVDGLLLFMFAAPVMYGASDMDDGGCGDGGFGGGGGCGVGGCGVGALSGGGYGGGDFGSSSGGCGGGGGFSSSSSGCGSGGGFSSSSGGGGGFGSD